MVLAARSLADDAIVRPVQLSKMNCKGDAGDSCCRRRTKTLANRKLVMDSQSERRDALSGRIQHVTISLKNEMVLDISAYIYVPTRGVDGKLRRGGGINCQRQVECQGGRVEGWAQIGRSRGQLEFQRPTDSLVFPLGHWNSTSWPSQRSLRLLERHRRARPARLEHAARVLGRRCAEHVRFLGRALLYGMQS